MSNNNNNLARPTNYICGSGALELSHIYATSVNIPGVNLNNPFIQSGGGTPININGDNKLYNTIQISLLMDEDWDIYFEFIDILEQGIDSTTGEFSNMEFDFFIDIQNSKGKHLFKMNLTNAKLQSIGDIVLDNSNEDTEVFFNIELVFDYIEYTRGNQTLKLAST